MSEPIWQIPSPDSGLPPEQVHLWRVSLTQPSDVYGCVESTLSPDERARARRLRFEHHRARFVMGRGTLRILLGRYLAVPPSSIRFVYGPQGKPSLEKTMATDDLHFNVAHTNDLAVFAFAWRRRVGIDVERIRRMDDINDLVARYFSPEEKEAFTKLLPGKRCKAFFSGWTRKEAYLKALGMGLSFPLDRFSVPLDPSDRLSPMSIGGDTEDVNGWSLFSFLAAPDYAAALVVEERTLTADRLVFWDLGDGFSGG